MLKGTGLAAHDGVCRLHKRTCLTDYGELKELCVCTGGGCGGDILIMEHTRRLACVCCLKRTDEVEGVNE